MTDDRPGEPPTGPPPDVPGALSRITAQLVDRPDSATVLELITENTAKLLRAAASGLMLLDPRGGPHVVAASDESARFVEVLQTQSDEGPCLECIDGDTVIAAPDLGAERDRWPQFAAAALAMGYRAVAALPLRLDGHAIGGLNVLYTGVTPLEDWQIRLGCAIADLTVLGLVQERGDRRADRLAERTLTAVNDRARLSQAVGMVAATLDLELDAARATLTLYARNEGRPLREITASITDGRLAPADLAAAVPDQSRLREG